MPLSARRLTVILTTTRYPAVRAALRSRFEQTDLEAWSKGQTPSPANRLILDQMSGNFVTRDGWCSPREAVA
jgi:hypothetical protein